MIFQKIILNSKISHIYFQIFFFRNYSVRIHLSKLLLLTNRTKMARKLTEKMEGNENGLFTVLRLWNVSTKISVRSLKNPSWNFSCKFFPVKPEMWYNWNCKLEVKILTESYWTKNILFIFQMKKCRIATKKNFLHQVIN